MERSPQASSRCLPEDATSSVNSLVPHGKEIISAALWSKKVKPTRLDKDSLPSFERFFETCTSMCRSCALLWYTGTKIRVCYDSKALLRQDLSCYVCKTAAQILTQRAEYVEDIFEHCGRYPKFLFSFREAERMEDRHRFRMVAIEPVGLRTLYSPLAEWSYAKFLGRISSHSPELADEWERRFLGHTPIPEELGSPETMRMAKIWLDSCIEKHPQCQKHTGLRPSTFFPPRLLDVSDDRVRLIQCAETPPKGSYVTLSHCWGENPTFLTLGHDNVQQLGDNVPMSELALTFQHAIQCVRSLGLRYLWIDSLCIFQKGPGSDQDWNMHARMMARIYSAGILNISAGRSRSAEDGFLGRRVLPLPKPCTAEPAWRSPNEGRALLSSSRDNRNQLASWPLGERAWAFQERLLSSRTLHFGPSEMFWECNAIEFASETFPAGGFKNPTAPGNQTAPFDLGNHHESDPAKISDEWWQLVRSYSGLRLTYPNKDKLHALAGVASAFASKYGLQDSYVAGVFLNDFPQMLRWEAHEQWIPAATERGVPSWSWAAGDGPINWKWATPTAHKGEYEAKLDGFSMAFRDPGNVYGPVHHAELRVTSRTIDMAQIPKWGHGGRPSPTFIIDGHARVHDKELLPASVENALVLVVSILDISMLGFKAVEGIILSEVGQDIYKRIGVLDIQVAPAEEELILSKEELTYTIV